MTKRRLVGFTVCVALFVALALAYWLAPIIGYTFRLEWMMVGCAIVATAWGIYASSDFAKKNSN